MLVLRPKDEDLPTASNHLCPFARHTRSHQNIQPQGSHLPGAIWWRGWGRGVATPAWCTSFPWGWAGRQSGHWPRSRRSAALVSAEQTQEEVGLELLTMLNPHKWIWIFQGCCCYFLIVTILINKSKQQQQKVTTGKCRTLQFSGGTISWVISPPWTQKMCFISPVKMSQTMTEKSTPPDTRERWS